MKKLMTIEIHETEDSKVHVSTSFHQEGPAAQALGNMGLAVRGMLQSMVKIGEGLGVSENDVLELCFGGKTRSTPTQPTR